jgi:hypothetical protein
MGDGDWGVGGAFDLVVPEEIAGVAAVVESRGEWRKRCDYVGAGESALLREEA